MASGERDTSKRLVALGIDDEFHRIILKEFGRPEDDGYAPAYRRFIEENTADYELTPQDLRELAEEMELRIEDRHARRAGIKIKRNRTKREAAGITETVINYQLKRLGRA